MKYAVISDIHGNYPALGKVIEDAKFCGAEKFIFLGDYIFDLPFSNEVLKCISDISDSVFIAGNKEGYIEGLLREDRSTWIHEQMGAMYQAFRELTDESFKFISELKECEYISMKNGGNIYACHCLKGLGSEDMKVYNCGAGIYSEMADKKYTRNDFLKYYQEMFRRDDFKKLTGAIDAKVILMGHNHLQGYCYIGDKLIINPGSCGIPGDFDNRAAYTILEELPDGYRVDERRVEYDVESLIRTTEKTEMYRCGYIWCELIFRTLRNGLINTDKMFEISHRIASKKGESGRFFSNETWREAYKVFMGEYDKSFF